MNDAKRKSSDYDIDKRTALQSVPAREMQALEELLKTNDMVLISFVEALLDEAGIAHVVLDQNMSVLEGSLGVLPRRVLVARESIGQARRLLSDAELATELPAPKDRPSQ